MISSLCLLDIHSLSVLVSLWQYFTLVFFWQLLASVTTHICLFQEFHDCHHLASLPHLIHLHLFHCRNLTLHWTRSRFYPSSNYLQYRPRVHYRRHLIHLNTPERRCRPSPSSCHYPFAAKRLLNTSRSEPKDVKRRRKQCVDIWRNFVHSYTITLHRFVMPQDPWRSVFLCVLRPTQSNCAFFPSWLMPSSFVYHSTLCYALHITEPYKRKNYLYYMEGIVGSICPQAEININKK